MIPMAIPMFGGMIIQVMTVFVVPDVSGNMEGKSRYTPSKVQTINNAEQDEIN